MIKNDRWYELNDEYLAAALKWLSLRLEQLANRYRPPEDENKDDRKRELQQIVTAVPQKLPPRRGFFQRFLEIPSATFVSAPLATIDPKIEMPEADSADVTSVDGAQVGNAAGSGDSAGDFDLEEAMQSAFKAMMEAESSSPPPAIVALGQRLGLTRFERDLLLLCTLMEFDTRIPVLCARAQGDLSRPYPTFALAMDLFDCPEWNVLSPERPLIYWRFIEVNRTGAQPLITSPLCADQRIVSYIKGLNYLDDRLSYLLTAAFVAADLEVDLPPTQRAYVDRIIRNLKGSSQRPPLIHLTGRDSPTKKMIAANASAKLGLYLYYIPIQIMPSQPNDIDAFSRLWQRESALLPIALYIDASDAEISSLASGHVSLINRFLTDGNGIFFLDTAEKLSGIGRDTLCMEISKPSPSEQRGAWDLAVGHLTRNAPAALSCQFDLNLSALSQVTRRALADMLESDAPLDEENQSLNEREESLDEKLWEACRSFTRPKVEGLAQKLDPIATWDDIVLPEGEIRLLHQISDQLSFRAKVYDDWGFRSMMNRGLGISVLFVGDSGTGKTMAAEVLANELKLDLYRIDLSAVMSKYIGETEKNLRRLFDAMEGSGAILFFDEADALFGKRSEVKDSHDRYANIEINYLLQSIEAYRGLAILATNMKSALDQAFMRRLRFTVEFRFPGMAERKLIWMRSFPPETPTIDLDYDRLARLNITGGSIRNIALNAAFLAAAEGRPVSMPHCLEAARIEFGKLKIPFNAADFAWPQGGKR
jgi:SpoVK/Ycf46/Vps4 family AAA+-type ATPase